MHTAIAEAEHAYEEEEVQDDDDRGDLDMQDPEDTPKAPSEAYSPMSMGCLEEQDRGREAVLSLTAADEGLSKCVEKLDSEILLVITELGGSSRHDKREHIQ